MSELKKYVVVIGENQKLCSQVQEALFEAGFNWNSGGKSVMYCDKKALIINRVIGGCIEYSGDFSNGNYFAIENEAGRDFDMLFPSDILNGGAMELDGAVAVAPEPRWFISVRGSSEGSIYEVFRNGWRRLPLNGKTEDCHLNQTYFALPEFEGDSRYVEITADDAAYIRDNAKRAKELGMELRKPVIGEDEMIGAEIPLVALCCTVNSKRVAGYRYCRKVEDKKEGPFCHNCGKKVDPKDSNYCSKCGAKLVK